MKDYDRTYWSNVWCKARDNMPRLRQGLMGSPTVLRMLLGYNVLPSTRGVPAGTGQHCRTAQDRGDRPRGPQRQRLLQMLAGPNGSTIVRALAIQRGLDLSKYKVWPK